MRYSGLKRFVHNLLVLDYPSLFFFKFFLSGLGSIILVLSNLTNNNNNEWNGSA